MLERKKLSFMTERASVRCWHPPEVQNGAWRIFLKNYLFDLMIPLPMILSFSGHHVITSVDRCAGKV